jgi:hypothetical protein
MRSNRVCRWRKSSFSSSGGDCVEVSRAGAVRDSKNPDGPTLRADVKVLVGAVKDGRLSH